ncbi:histidine kinase [Petroclostridium sp. X23]|uniref:sensor histidine kinase n=1 Tax=Petroclostridium sp. X23 TaxID=3045146 RepID=UPI0024ADDCDB|nr:histidine kinase [Petroclostridium sp. X23]WHH60506.1 histidine kinase [Petroclostridium sp. X23]
MKYYKTMINKINNLISSLRMIRIRSNLLVVFGLYTIMLFMTLLIYGYFSYVHVADYKLKSKVSHISGQLRALCLSLDNVDDLTFIEERFKNSQLLDKGAFILVDHKGEVILSTYRAGERLVDIESTIIEKCIGRFGVLDGMAAGNKNYFFYERLDTNDLLILYFIPTQDLKEEDIGSKSLILLSGLICVFVYLIIIIRFKNKIYKPIVNIEHVIHALVEGSTDFSINNVKENNILHPLYFDLNKMSEKLKDLVLKEYNANIMKKQAELDALQSKINPHFLYNTLDSIRGLAITEGVKKIETMTKALSDLFRYSISNTGNLVTLKEELKSVDNYLMIQQYRFNNKFIIINNVDDDTLDYCIPKLLFQPIVENAIHHGLERKIGKGTITINASRTQTRLLISIQDDGVGIGHDKLIHINNMLVTGKVDSTETKGVGLRIGLRNVNERIRLNFGNEYGLRIYSGKGIGTKVEIILPLITR